jgi:hypothetical protein
MGLGVFFAVVMTIAALYTFITVVFAEVNPIAVLAAVSVALAGLVWFKRTIKNA